MLEQNRKRLVDELRKWLQEEDVTLRWLASEIIGYFSSYKLISEPGIREKLEEGVRGLAYDQSWEQWQLNNCWALSKNTDNYKKLHEFLMKSENPSNLSWLLEVYLQMPLEGHAEPRDFISVLEDFRKRENIPQWLKAKAYEIKTKLDSSTNRNSPPP